MEEARDSCWLGGSVARISGWFGMQPAVWLAFWPKRLDAGQTINFESCLNRRGAERRTSTFYFFIFFVSLAFALEAPLCRRRGWLSAPAACCLLLMLLLYLACSQCHRRRGSWELDH